MIAPEIHTWYLSYLTFLIGEYIAIRKKFPQPLRPKHHFLIHYPELILKFGPLIKVWTLRFESKHTFFKRRIRSIKNFLNVTKSLSVSHELFQSYIRNIGDYKCGVEVGDGSDFNVNYYNIEIQNIIKNANLSTSFQEYKNITLKGVSYRKEDAVFVSCAYHYNVEVGQIIKILYNDQTEETLAIVEVLETVFQAHLRAYQLGSRIRYQCINFNDLPSNEKLHIYHTNLFNFVKPNFGLVKKVP